MTTCLQLFSPGAGSREPQSSARFRAMLILIALFASALPARGQAARPVGIEPGATIRFQIGGDNSFRSGVLSRLTGDSLVVERCPTCQGRLLYARSELTRLDVSKRTPAGFRMLGGYAIGAITGLALGVAAAVTCTGGGDKCDGGPVLVAFGGVFGGLVGVLVGYLTAYKWEPVQLGR
jgi:hypothetical protein